MTPEIDYHALALAQIDVHDTESDRIAASLPDDLKNHVSGLYNVPARGSVPGPARLEKAREIQVRAENEFARRAGEEARLQAARESEHHRRAEVELKLSLGLPTHQPLPPEFNHVELREWRDWMKANPNRQGEFAKELANRKANARAASPIRPTML